MGRFAATNIDRSHAVARCSRRQRLTQQCCIKNIIGPSQSRIGKLQNVKKTSTHPILVHWDVFSQGRKSGDPVKRSQCTY